MAKEFAVLRGLARGGSRGTPLLPAGPPHRHSGRLRPRANPAPAATPDLAPDALDLLEERKTQLRRRPAKASTLSPLHETDLARQQARAWSAHVGAVAAARPAPAFTPLDAAPSALTPRLSAILSHLRQQRQRQELVADKLRAQEFIMGP
jgi:hypothetical protein